MERVEARVRISGVLAVQSNKNTEPGTCALSRTYLDTHDGTNTSVTLVESHHFGERVGEADVCVNDEDLAWIAFEDCISEVVETARCS